MEAVCIYFYLLILTGELSAPHVQKPGARLCSWGDMESIEWNFIFMKAVDTGSSSFNSEAPES